MMGAAFAGLDNRTLSTMCLVTTSVIGCCLIFRISQPFTLLRRLLFASIVSGLVIGVVAFPDFFSIARLSLGLVVYLVIIALACSLLFMKLAGAMDAQAPKTTRLATGFGRGVRVTRRRRGVPQVTSTGSTARRVITRAYASMTRRQEHRALERAESHAEEALDDSVSPRSAASEPSDSREANRAPERVHGSARARGVKGARSSSGVSVTNSGIRVKMPARRRGRMGNGHTPTS